MATAPKTQAKKGRPTKYSVALDAKICAALAMGSSLRTVCSSPEMPSVVTVFNWLHDPQYKDTFLKHYTRAKQESADALADEILDISDDGSNDWMEKRYGQDSDSTWVTNGEALQRSKLRVDTRKFLMAKMKPKVYGDKLDLTTDGEKLPAPLLGGVSIDVKKEADDGASE